LLDGHPFSSFLVDGLLDLSVGTFANLLPQLVVLNLGAPWSRELIIEQHRTGRSNIARFFIAFENIDYFVIKITLVQIFIFETFLFAVLVVLVFNQMLSKCFCIQFQLLSTLRSSFTFHVGLASLLAAVLVIHDLIILVGGWTRDVWTRLRIFVFETSWPVMHGRMHFGSRHVFPLLRLIDSPIMILV